jgi:peptidoglycan/LPS O-acetylase OafA/YrhL
MENQLMVITVDPNPTSKTKVALPMNHYRPDIQILRALAVILVVVFHLNLEVLTTAEGTKVQLLQGGFIGVDVFFCISGYLVVGSVIREERKSAFNVFEFTARRIKRLFLPRYAIHAIYYYPSQSNP